MVLDDRIEEPKEGQESVPSEVEHNLPVVVGEPNTPRGLPEPERKELQKRAEELAVELSAAEGSKEMELIDSIATVGTQAQRFSAGPTASACRRNAVPRRIGQRNNWNPC